MKAVMPAAEVHKQYQEMMTAFRALIPDPTLRMQVARQADPYFRQQALGVWQAGNASSISEIHVDYYNALFTPGNPRPEALYWEVATGVSGYDLFTPPPFFTALREYDRRTGSSLARRFIDQMTLLLLLVAATDGGISEEEAAFVNACGDTLGALCQKDGLTGARPAIQASEFVTRKAEPGSQAQKQVQAPEKTFKPEEKESMETLLAELDELCGLEKVKQDVRSLINLVKVRNLRQKVGLPTPPLSLHLVFLGNPGTGKTTVARLLARLYHSMGVLSKGQLVEVDRSGLVAGYVGQTALKTQEVVQKALGGVLFLDEAYALVKPGSPQDFGHEAIEVLLKNMEDHREDLVVIVAGYPEPMRRFIEANPGLESRFNKYFYFEDYTAEQLETIFASMAKKHGYTLSEEGTQWLREELRRVYESRDEKFGNAREVRNLFETAVARQANRVAGLEQPTREQLMELKACDLQEHEEQ